LSKIIRSAKEKSASEGSPYSLQDIEAEGRAIIREARAKANSIIEEASQKAREVSESLVREAEEAAKKRGFEAGMEEGKREAYSKAADELQVGIKNLGALVRSFSGAVEDGRRRLAKAGERDLVTLALAIARKIVEREVVLAPESASQIAERAVALLSQRDAVELLVNPKDAETIESYVPELKRAFSDLENLRVTPDESISRGGCIARTSVGSVDASIESQIDQIARELFEEVR